MIDGDYIPYSPFFARENGLVTDVPIMTGICREDGSPYTLICEYFLERRQHTRTQGNTFQDLKSKTVLSCCVGESQGPPQVNNEFVLTRVIEELWGASRSTQRNSGLVLL